MGLTMYLRLTTNLWESSSLNLPCSGIIGLLSPYPDSHLISNSQPKTPNPLAHNLITYYPISKHLINQNKYFNWSSKHPTLSDTENLQNYYSQQEPKKKQFSVTQHTRQEPK